MKYKNLFLTFLVLISPATQSAEKHSSRIGSTVYELEAKISKTLEERIVQFIGTENIWVSTNLDVSIDKLETHLEKEDLVDEPKEKFTDLPGLNLSEDGAFVKGDDKNDNIILIDRAEAIPTSTILSHTKGLNITVYHKALLDRKVERIIRSLIEEKLSALKVKVEVKFNHRKAQALEATDFDDGKKIRFEPDSFAKSFHNAVVVAFQNFLDTHIVSPFKKGVIAIVSLAIIAFALAIFFIIRALIAISNGISVLSKASANLDQGSRISGEATTEGLSVKSMSEDVSISEKNGEESDIKKKILDIHENYREVISNFFADSMEKKNFKDIWCLTQILGEKILFEGDQLAKNKHFKHYNAFLKDNMFKASNASDYNRIYQKLMGLMLYPDVYFSNGIKEHVNRLGQQDLADFFTELSAAEIVIVSEMTDPLRVASLINSGILDAEDVFGAIPPDINLSVLRKLDSKILSFSQKRESNHNRVLGMITFLNQEKYDQYISQHGLTERFCFTALYEAKKETAEDFFKGLNVEELCSLLPMLSKEMEQQVLELLPEIKLARVNQGRKLTNQRSQHLMAQLYDVLLDQDLKSELVAMVQSPVPPLKVVA